MLRSRSCSPAMAQNLKSVSPEHLSVNWQQQEKLDDDRIRNVDKERSLHRHHQKSQMRAAEPLYNGLHVHDCLRLAPIPSTPMANDPHTSNHICLPCKLHTTHTT